MFGITRSRTQRFNPPTTSRPSTTVRMAIATSTSDRLMSPSWIWVKKRTSQAFSKVGEILHASSTP